jgi:hypothetical protein
VAAIGADDVRTFADTDVEVGAIEDQPGFVGARALQGLVDGLAQGVGQGDGRHL